MFDVIIMAGGLGKRMNSDIPKVLHKIKGIPMLVKIINEVKKLKQCNKIMIIVGIYKEMIKNTLEEYNLFENKDIIFVLQEQPLGTGHAIMCAKEMIGNNPILILSGDIPLITVDTINDMINHYNGVGTIMTTMLDNPYGYGRIYRHYNNFKIIEEKDASEFEKKICEVNCGIYVFNPRLLQENICKITNNNAQYEYYLTDITKFILCNIYILPKEKQIELTNVNTKKTLDELNNLQTK